MTDLELYEDEAEQSLTPAEIQEQNQAEIVAQTERISRLSRELAELSTSSPASEGVLVTTEATPASKKRELGALRVEAVRHQEVIKQKREEIERASDEMERAISKQMQLAQEMLAPLEKYVKRLEEGIWMVNLYLGRDEEIVSLRDGEPAGPEVPVSIRQLVLYMDEECAIDPEGDGIDALDIDLFDEWLLADPAHVNQVLPEEKGVVALLPRRNAKDYGDPWKNMVMGRENEKTYFLIRNGDRLWRTWTEFNVGERLVPLADEFAEYFYEKHGIRLGGQRQHRIRIEPGTLAWERAEESADAKQRHYMRVGLILQGLVDRTTVFHPLPDGGVNFLDHEHGGKSWRFVIDAENLIDTGRLPFREWQRAKGRELRVGMRIVGAFNRWSDGESYEHSISPRGAEKPPTGELLLLEEKGPRPDSFIVRYKRKQKIWKHYTQVEAQRRASMVVDADDSNIIPFDAVTEEEMLVYLNARLDRHLYAEMFPVLKAAVRAKRAERAAEVPFRTMLVGVIARDNDVSAEEAEAEVDELIGWWKLRNKYHRPLIGEGEDQAKAVRMIVAEDKRRRRARGPREEALAAIRSALASQALPVLAIAQRRTGGYIGIVEATYDIFENVDYQTPYVHLYEFNAKGEAKEAAKHWRLLTPTLMSSLNVVWQTEKFEDWDIHASSREHLTGPEIELLGAQVIKGLKRPIAVAYDPRPKRCSFYTWEFKSDPVIDDSPFTGRSENVKVEERSRGWARKGTAAPRLRDYAYSSKRPNMSYQEKPWDTRPSKSHHDPATLGDGKEWFDDERVDRERLEALNKYIVLFHDPEVEQRWRNGERLYQESDDARREKSNEVWVYLRSIAAQWEARREFEEQKRFLEDYLDIGLWEGHKKTLPSSIFEYPYSHYRNYRSEPDALALMVEYHVEKGIPLDGLTVWEAATTNYPPDDWRRKRAKREYFGHFTASSADKIPEDIRDLVFGAHVETEDDGED